MTASTFHPKLCNTKVHFEQTGFNSWQKIGFFYLQTMKPPCLQIHIAAFSHKTKQLWSVANH